MWASLIHTYTGLKLKVSPSDNSGEILNMIQLPGLNISNNNLENFCDNYG